MTHVTIYTKQSCPYCHKALALLNSKGVELKQIAVDGDLAALDKMSVRANGRRTVPQIFIGDRHVGGCDDLYELESQGKLDPLLNTAPS